MRAVVCWLISMLMECALISICCFDTRPGCRAPSLLKLFTVDASVCVRVRTCVYVRACVRVCASERACVCLRLLCLCVYP